MRSLLYPYRVLSHSKDLKKAESTANIVYRSGISEQFMTDDSNSNIQTRMRERWSPEMFIRKERRPEVLIQMLSITCVHLSLADWPLW